MAEKSGNSPVADCFYSSVLRPYFVVQQRLSACATLVTEARPQNQSINLRVATTVKSLPDAAYDPTTAASEQQRTRRSNKERRATSFQLLQILTMSDLKALIAAGAAGALVPTAVYYLTRNRTGGKKRKVLFQDEWTNKRIKFCTSISTAISTDDSLQFAESILGDRQCGPILFKRDCYKDLFKLVEKSREAGNAAGVVITGTPGIGKTMFGVQCIHTYAVEKHTTVLYKFRSEGYFIFSSHKVWQVTNKQYYELQGHGPLFSGLIKTTDEESLEFVAHLKTRTGVIYIVDLDKNPFDESISNAFTIILSSTNREKYSTAISSATLPMIVLWMETWSKREVQQHFGGKVFSLDERFARHGGVPRYLLWPEDVAKHDLDSVLDSTTSAEFQVALDPDCKIEKFNGRLVHYSKVPATRHTATATFASEEIMKRVAIRFYLRERLGFQATIDKMKFDSDFGSPRGCLSELVWHHQFREGGNFQLKNLSSLTTKNVNVARFQGSVVPCEYDMRDLSNLKEGDYVAPIGNAFPAVDAFMVTKNPFFDPQYQGKVLVGFQMAGSKKTSGQHWLKGPHVVSWIEKVKKLHTDVAKVVIVFIVNDEDLSGWNTQSFKTDSNVGKKWNAYKKLPNALKDIEQFALGMKAAQRDFA